MAYFRCGGGGIPSSLKSGMNDVLNKKFGTSTTYAPATWPDNVNLLGPLPEKTVSGAIASFSDGADDVPISEGTFYIAPSQSGTGTPSPSNPRPIVGYTDMTIQQTGKNLLHNEMEDGTTGGIDYSLNSDGSIDCSGKVTNVNSTRVLATNIKLPAGSYVLSGATNSIRLRCMIYNKDGTYTSRNDSGSGVTCSITTDTDYIEFRVRASTLDEVIDTTIYPMFEVGSTPSQFEAYKSKTPITVSLGRTIYGGYVTNDKVVKTWSEPIVFTGAESENWIWGQNGGFYRANITVYGFAYTVGARSECLCNMGTYKASGNDYNACFIYGNPTSAQFFFYPPQGVESLADFKTWLSSNNLQMVAELATPIVITGLDEISLSTYLGDNNIWCDTGDSEVTYRADINLALNQ